MLSAKNVTPPKPRRHTRTAPVASLPDPAKTPAPSPEAPPEPPAAARADEVRELVVRPIGFARSPFVDRVSAPRQPSAAGRARGTIELLPGHNFEHALDDLEAWDHIWVVFWFHLNAGWRPKVLPPRSTQRRGLFATRAPHRPNPLGLSVLELERVEGLTLHVRDIDLIDGTPVLDIKPYVPFTDVVPSANSGWLETPDPGPKFTIAWSTLAETQARWLRDTFGVDLTVQVNQTLSLGYEPHPYRRIRRREQGYRLAVKDWRVDFTVEGTQIHIHSIHTGYRPSQLAASAEAAVALHRVFVDHFGKDRNG
jgi:tRNA (adenine37-N6)-methyltransferase